ncbi:hypothetical protein [Marinisporobacter balticus]|uniref:Uncharacterized protein n=1 Tax=Marinisporobacter balticus TaxID=2018667 RepID=A0A4R2L6W2_9FIRM|nr:hypothetical protein [Marinisporobacter balticus]TCO79839.1 hypothetical protein EV214_10171 [Marinisporobacter balticus]
MKKSVGNYISKRNTDKFSEIDFHDFLDMVQSGLCDEEIANELGVHKGYVEKLKDEIKKDYDIR